MFLEETLFFWTKIYFSILFYFSDKSSKKKFTPSHRAIYIYKNGGLISRVK